MAEKPPDDKETDNIEVYKKLMDKYRAKDESEDGANLDNCPVCGTELIEGPVGAKNCEKCGYST
jgi:hypothetical protein